MGYKAKSGIFTPKNPGKYVGNVDNIVYRSLWERRFMAAFDISDDIIQWSSEEISIPYLFEIDNKIHNYFIDFFIKLRSGEKYLIEIKPYNQTIPPKKTKNQSNYLNECITYIKNQNKWNHAKSFAKTNNMFFIVITEHDMKKYKYVKFLLNEIQNLYQKQ